jgi:glyoxylase-like metal-dependent hydrolase (beta-lactamase superfamily II)
VNIAVVEASSDVFLVVGPETNWCLIRDGDAITLVDAAWPKDYSYVVESLAQIGATADHVEAVVLTHAHPDHVGVAEQLRSEHGATVRTLRSEAGHAMGQYHQRVGTMQLIARAWRPSVISFLATAIRGGGSPVSVAEVKPFDKGPLDAPGQLVAIPTPGHTSGHCSFHLPDHGILITGDALVNRNVLTGKPGARLMPHIFNHDTQQAMQSLDQLAAVSGNLILPGHGELLHQSPAQAVDQARDLHATGGWWDR